MGATANLCEHRRRDPHEGPLLVRNVKYRTSPLGEHAALRRSSQRVYGLGVKDQRFGHARLARASALLETGPCSASSSAR
jgi:hypothetical protein